MYPETKTYLTFKEGIARYIDIGWVKRNEDGSYIEGSSFLDGNINKQKLANAIHSNIRTMEFGNTERNNQYFNTLSGLFADYFIDMLKEERMIMLVGGNLICDSDIYGDVVFSLDCIKHNINMQHYLEGNCN